MPKISDLPTDTAPDSADIIPFVDVTASRTESVTVANLAASTAFAGQFAPLASPTFTGDVVVPTADADGEAVNKGQMDAADALKAPINNPTFTGNVVVPDADADTEALNRRTADARHPRGVTDGTNNAVGLNAQESLTTGIYNNAVGHSAQQSLTEGSFNNAVGLYAQQSLTEGSFNNAVGSGAQLSLTTGTNNNAVGYYAQRLLTTGNFNNAVGRSAQESLTTGTYNNAVGHSAQQSLTTGTNNNAVGYDAQESPGGVSANATTTASNQTSVGNESGQGSTTQSDDITTIGFRALADGTGATSLGSQANAAYAGSVALGNGTTTTAVDQVHVGSRRISGVAAAQEANDAAQVTAIDAATGRLAIGGREIGDTDWRDVTADIANGWTTHHLNSKMNLRRSGNVVTFHISRGLVGTAATDDVFYTLPSGFRMATGDVYTVLQPIIIDTTPTFGMLAFEPDTGTLETARAAAVRMAFSMTWMTDDAWPATLPGTAT